MDANADHKGPVVIIAKVVAAEGKRDDVARHLGVLVERSHELAGILQYQLHEDPADDSSFWLYEHYESEEALAEHRARKVLDALGPEFPQALAGPPSINVLQPLAGKVPFGGPR
jgi:quinol monooxygenase YgiN